MTWLIILGIALGVVALWLTIAAMFRRVTPTNEVHIVQSSKSTTPYGKGFDSSTYYAWPSWLPKIGVEVSLLPMNIFVVDLVGYSAYDNGKVPFVVDVKAWFRVESAALAAQRVDTFGDLKDQLDDIMRGAVRKILAGEDIEKIMENRKELGDVFIQDVADQAAAFGIKTENIEFMDIRDPNDGSSTVIEDIMSKKKSAIEKEARVEIAENEKVARIKEIEAKKESDVKQQEADEVVGKRRARKDQEVGISIEQANQKVQEQAALTKEKEMAVAKVANVRQAEIIKEAEIVKAEQNKATQIIHAEAQKQQMVIDAKARQEQAKVVAQGEMEAEQNRAKGIEAVGDAEAKAKESMEVALIAGQVQLAKEIAETPEYMSYLLGIEEIKAQKDIGIEKAKALQAGDTKIIATTGNVGEGLNSVLDVFSGKGGMKVGTMLETLKQTPAGQALWNKLMGEKSKESEVTVIEGEAEKPTPKKSKPKKQQPKQ